MAFKNKFKRKKEPFPKNARVRVKNSYYTFSKEYPAAKIIKTKRVKRKKERASSAFKIALACVCFLLIVAASYFTVSLGLNFSNKPTETTSPEFSNEATSENENLLQASFVRALYMPHEFISDKKMLSSFVKKLERRDCNSVVIDFKTADGKLVYSSENKLSKSAKCALFDNETFNDALRVFKNAEINVIAAFSCFKDPCASSAEPSFAVKYKDTDVLWRDELSKGKGDTWLNPYSSGACDYLLSLLQEISSTGVRGIILQNVSFPVTSDLSTAGFPGEKSESGRNAALLSFIEKAKSTLPSDCFLLVEQNCNDALNGNEALYFGSISKTAADGLCADTDVLPEGYFPDKKSNYSSMLSLFSQIRERQGESSFFVPLISNDSYTGKYVRQLKNGGFDSYIIFDESGNY